MQRPTRNGTGNYMWKHLRTLRIASAGFIHPDCLTRKHKPHLDKQSELQGNITRIFLNIYYQRRKKTNPREHLHVREFWDRLLDLQGHPSCIYCSSHTFLVMLANKIVMLWTSPHGVGWNTRQWNDSQVGCKIFLWYTNLPPYSTLFDGDMKKHLQTERRKVARCITREADLLEQSSQRGLQYKESNKRKGVDA